MKKKLWSLLVVTIAVLVALPIGTMAHSGRTDSSGGHKDNKNKSGLGSYHYHCGGNPAHLHDGGYCPYTYTEEESYEEEAVQSTSVEISHDTSEINVGDSISVSGKVYPSDAPDSKVTWSSSDKSVATVGSDGKIMAVGAGTVTITASTANGTTGSFELTVNKIKVQDLILEKEPTNMNVGEKQKLKFTVSPENATDKKVSWSSSNSEIAGVDSSGVISANKLGKATITAACADEITKSWDIEILEIPVAKIEIDMKTKTDIAVGESVELKIKVLPENATDKSLKFVSDNAEVATVNEIGKIEARSKGAATISVINKDVTKTININVVPITVETVEIITEPQRLEVGKSIDLKVNVYPENAEDKSVTWTVDKGDYAKIEDGKLIATGSGTVTVTASANGVSSSFEIEVYSNTLQTIIIVVIILVLIGGAIFVFVKKFKGKQE